MKPDIIISHPRDILYPWWMWRINKDRDLFEKVIIVMTQNATGTDYSSYILNNVDGCEVIEEYVDDGRDWRNAAIKEALKVSYSSHVLFLEQDFLVEDGFWEDFLSKGKDYNSVGFVEGNRFHPACLLVRRDIIQKTKEDFSVQPDVGDHFKKFSEELMEVGGHANMRDLKLPGWYHMAGLSQNFRLDKNWYGENEFFAYLLQCLLLPERYLHPTWKSFTKVLKEKMGTQILNTKISKFFPT